MNIIQANKTHSGKNFIPNILNKSNKIITESGDHKITPISLVKGIPNNIKYKNEIMRSQKRRQPNEQNFRKMKLNQWRETETLGLENLTI